HLPPQRDDLFRRADQARSRRTRGAPFAPWWVPYRGARRDPERRNRRPEERDDFDIPQAVMHAPRDILEIFLQPGEFYFGDRKTRIRTLLGSCVAITLWHPRLHIGGMSHYMLSSRPRPKKDEALNGRYAVEVMELFMRELSRSHTKPREYQVKIFGGSRMFRHSEKEGKARNDLGISERNVQIGRELVTRHG